MAQVVNLRAARRAEAGVDPLARQAALDLLDRWCVADYNCGLQSLRSRLVAAR
jgi:hypothetical protein